MEVVDESKRIDRLSREVLRLSRNELLVHLRFLDSALSRLPLVPDNVRHIASDGRSIRYNPVHVLKTYSDEQNRMTRDYLHTVLHCAFRHAFVGAAVDRDCWDLAADIAVEHAIDSMALPGLTVRRQEQQSAALSLLQKQNVMLTAEKIYRVFLDLQLTKRELLALREPFFADDHDLWYAPLEGGGEDDDGEDGQREAADSQQGHSADTQEDGGKGAAPQGGSEEQERKAPELRQENGETSESKDGGKQPGDDGGEAGENEPKREAQPEDTPAADPRQTQRRGAPNAGEREGENGQNGERGDVETAMEGEGERAFSDGEASGTGMGSEPVTRKGLSEQWSDIARRMQVDMETGPRMRGDHAGGMMQNLKAVTREAYDYSDFLRQFSVPGEAVQINDDEFDYIYYTYGLDLYGKMPLVEPLEYKEVKRIREFVIAIDTSGSVKGDAVQRFIQKTYNILMEQESFFTKINLHIIQCDAALQEVVKIECREDFDAYIADMTLKGFGGTDFRPVFAYVERMLLQKEFINLKGLIYFTDGQGVYPAEKPPYDAAFVFVRDDYEEPKVPVWAIRLVLDKNDI